MLDTNSISAYFTTWYSFCPNCKSNLAQHATKISCPNCEFVLYFNPSSTTSIVLHQKDKVLLVQRGIEPKKGWWDLPGGFLDLDETAEEGIIRELQEELEVSLQPSELEYLGSHADVYGRANVPIVNLGYAAQLDDTAKLVAQDDVASYKWFTKEDIPWDKLGFASLGNILKDFFRNKHSISKYI